MNPGETRRESKEPSLFFFFFFISKVFRSHRATQPDSSLPQISSFKGADWRPDGLRERLSCSVWGFLGNQRQARGGGGWGGAALNQYLVKQEHVGLPAYWTGFLPAPQPCGFTASLTCFFCHFLMFYSEL